MNELPDSDPTLTNSLATGDTTNLEDSVGPSFAPTWADDAPRGGRVVLARALKESAAVPLFLAQTFVQSLRDVGYDSTTSALCEHVDNSIVAGAKEVRIFFRQAGRTGDLQTDVLVWDDGRGMAPNVLQVATSFGGSMSFGSRSGIGRFGMGMKTAGLSMSPTVEIYSWQEPGAFYRMVLDSEAIGRDRANLIALPSPEFFSQLPPDLADFFSKPMRFPKNRDEQALPAENHDDLREVLGSSGTIVYMPECDRLSFATDRTLVEHATKEMAHVYRRALARGLKLYINNRLVHPVDPTLSMPGARHAKSDDLNIKTSRLVVAKKIKVRHNENKPDSFEATIKLFALPIEEWSFLPRKTLKDIGVFSGHNVSILRNDREVFAGYIAAIAKRHSDTNWFRVEIDFPGELDEAFGVASNKQGVRPKGYVIDAINEAIGADIVTVRNEIQRFQAERNTRAKGVGLSAAELRANETDPFQSEILDTAELSETEKVQIEANLRGLAVAVKRDGEDDEQAFERVSNSKYIITYRHDEYWPFYHVENKFGRVILTINTAHPFYAELYEPLAKSVPMPLGEDEAEAIEVPSQQGPVVALELLLLSLARAQSVMGRENPEAATIFDAFRRKWSETYRVQLSA